MAPVNVHLIALKSDATTSSFLSAVSALPQTHRPLYVGKCQHWIHAPHISVAALTGTGPEIKKWDYLLVNKTPGGDHEDVSYGLVPYISSKWSITAEVDETQVSQYPQVQRARLVATAPPLPDGWNPKDHSALDAATPPPDLEASLGLASYPLGSRTDSGQRPVLLKDFVYDFGTKHTGPVAMFNLLAYNPSQRPRYFEYVAAFTASVGSKYGGDAMFLGLGVSNWSSKEDEAGQCQNDPPAAASSPYGWEDIGLIHYPSIWHFGKMLDDPEYMDADRRFKQGVLKDNPIMCCTEVEVKYEK